MLTVIQVGCYKKIHKLKTSKHREICQVA